jgi:fatty-acyl-CoA synthase
MFHCNGWCFPWTMALIAGTSVCLRRVDPALIFPLIREHRRSRTCAARPSSTACSSTPGGCARASAHGEGPDRRRRTAGRVIEGCEAAGIELTHVYGLTEVYGPAAVCAKQEQLGRLPIEERAASTAARA